MSPVEREHLTRLEPELRGSHRDLPLPRATLSPALSGAMMTLRVYVVVTVGFVVMTLIRGIH